MERDCRLLELVARIFGSATKLIRSSSRKRKTVIQLDRRSVGPSFSRTVVQSEIPKERRSESVGVANFRDATQTHR